MSILVTGAKGMLGHDLCPCLRQQGYDVVEWDLPEHDVTNVETTIAEIRKLKPRTIYHLAAYTDVDGAERHRAEAYQANTLGTWTVALGARDARAHMVYISTDYVFDGTKGAPYLENDRPGPVNYYGTTKLLGEQTVRKDVRRHYICRSSWLYGRHGRNFVDTILRLSRERDSIDVVDDQQGSPTYTRDFAPALARFAKGRHCGTYHVTNSGVCSWYQFALEIVRLAGLKLVVRPTTSDKYVRPARRPAFSALDNGLFEARFNYRLRPWQDALKDYLRETGYLKLD